MSPKTKEIKAKLNKLDLIKHKRFCTAKETIEGMKRQTMELEKIYDQQGLIFKLYKWHIQFNIFWKIKKWKEKTYFQIRHTDDQQAHENMLNTDNFRRNANQNHNEITSHLSEWLSSKYIQITNGKDVGEMNCCSLLVQCKLVQPLWKTIWSFLKKTKYRMTIQSSNPTSGCTTGSKDRNTSLEKIHEDNVHSSIIYSCQDMETSQVSINW